MAEQQEYDVLLKVLMIGDSDVGKSSILLRFTDDLYNDEQPVTIGVDFKIKMVEFGGKKINLTIWDTAGQEKFRGTQGIILVYDVTRRDSFANLTSWLSEIETYTTNPDVVKLLVGNKIDKENREVTREEAVEFARSQAMLFIECSAKTRLGVQQAFEELVMRILETPTLLKSNAKPTVSVDSSADDGQSNAYSCYC